MKYALYTVSGNEEKPKSYFELKEEATYGFKSDSLEEILRMTIEGLNNEELFDVNWFFVTDEENGIILFS